MNSTTTLFIALFAFANLVLAYQSKRNRCEVNTAPACQSFYNTTRFPNLLKQSSQSEALSELGQYKQLIRTNCAPHLRLFLCSVLFPMCTMLDKIVPPCRSLCEESKAGCEKIMLNYASLPWPQRLRCNQYPVSGPGVICIEFKEKLHIKKTWVKVNKKTKIAENEKAILKCDEDKKKIRFTKIKFIDNKNCRRHTSQEAIRKRCDGEQLCEFKLEEITRGQGPDCTPGKIGAASVKYTCQDDKPPKQMILDYGQDANLYCKGSKRRIQILNVQFRDETAADTCITPQAFCSVSQSCTGKKSCALWADRSYIHSPCKEQKPKLIVDYECGKISSEEKVVEGYWENINLECPTSSVLSIIRAEYLGQSCKSKNIHCAVDLYCKKRRQCQLKDSDVSAVKCEDDSKVRIWYLCT